MLICILWHVCCQWCLWNVFRIRILELYIYTHVLALILVFCVWHNLMCHVVLHVECRTVCLYLWLCEVVTAVCMWNKFCVCVMTCSTSFFSAQKKIYKISVNSFMFCYCGGDSYWHIVTLSIHHHHQQHHHHHPVLQVFVSNCLISC
jgi:hypothetical protein